MTWWLFIFTLPSILLGWLLGGLSLALGFSKKPRYVQGVLVTTWRDWWADRWHYSTTLGFWIGMHPNAGPKTEYHEIIHVQTYEDMNLLGAAIGGLVCIVSWPTGLIIWATSGAAWLLPNFLTGWIRFGTAHRGSSHERYAYAATEYENR